MIQAGNGGIRLARKVAEDDIKRWRELRDKGYTFDRIGSEVGWASETIRKHIGGEKKLKEKEKEKEKVEPETDLELQARAFSNFEEGKNTTDLVREKICPIDVARVLGEKYAELKNMARPDLEILEGRIENMSHLVRCTLGNAKIKINCPVCGQWGYLTIQKIDGVERWVCGSCGRIPF